MTRKLDYYRMQPRRFQSRKNGACEIERPDPTWESGRPLWLIAPPTNANLR